MSGDGTSQKAKLGRVLIAEGDDTQRKVSTAALSEAGFEVVQAADGLDLLPLVRRESPDLLLLDNDLPHADALLCVQAIRADERCEAVRIVLTCRPTADKARLQALAAAGIGAILIKPALREATLEKVREALSKPLPPRVQSEKAPADGQAKSEISPTGKRSAARRVKSNNSLLERDTVCPFHDQPVLFHRYTLRTGRIVTDTDFFDITVYQKASPGADFANGHVFNVIVCPECFFASNNAGYFIQPGDDKAKPYRFTPATIQAITQGAARRKELAAKASGDFFTEKRTMDDALVSYDLAIECSKTLLEVGRHEFAMELLRTANYHLRLAHLHEQLGRPLPEGANPHAEAFAMLKQAFAELEGPSLYKAIYQLVALGIYLGDNTAASRYMDHMKTLERESSVGGEDLTALQRYLNRCRKAWEDRRMHRAPGVEEDAEAA